MSGFFGLETKASFPGQLTFVFPKPLDSFSSLHLLSSCWWACIPPDGFAAVCGTLCSTCGLGRLPGFLSSLPLLSFSVVIILRGREKLVLLVLLILFYVLS